jgi:integrase/recombinase XerD
MSKFIKKMKEEMDLRGHKPRTQYAYLKSMQMLMDFHNCRFPEELDLDDIKEFLLSVKKYNGKDLAATTMNRHTVGIKFFYKTVLNRKTYDEDLPRRKTKKTIPIVLSLQEIKLMLDVVKNIKYKAVFMTLYSTSMRLSELQNLTAKDIDGSRMVVHIRYGKGGKDREALLSEHLISTLRQYWKENKDDKSRFLFSSSIKTYAKKDITSNALTHTGVSYIVSTVAKGAGVEKKLALTL